MLNSNGTAENNLINSADLRSSKNYSRSEKQILNLLQEGALTYKKDYVINVGYREFYNNGLSFGICSNDEWKQKKQLSGFNELISSFYTNELLTLKRNGHVSSIRVQGTFHNAFLKTISKCGLGNVLVIYKFYADKIQGYYFLAHGNDYNAVNAFSNDLKLFKNLVDALENKINKIIKDNCLSYNAAPLLPKHALDELFLENNKRKYQLFSDSSLQLSEKQSQLLYLLSKGYTKQKEIAKQMNIVPKTAEHHLNKLKQKTNIFNKQELVLLAKSISK
jgi:DNA-binding CsgD family transcriptional regulator